MITLAKFVIFKSNNYLSKLQKPIINTLPWAEEGLLISVKLFQTEKEEELGNVRKVNILHCCPPINSVCGTWGAEPRGWPAIGAWLPSCCLSVCAWVYTRACLCVHPPLNGAFLLPHTYPHLKFSIFSAHPPVFPLFSLSLSLSLSLSFFPLLFSLIQV